MDRITHWNVERSILFFCVHVSPSFFFRCHKIYAILKSVDFQRIRLRTICRTCKFRYLKQSFCLQFSVFHSISLHPSAASCKYFTHIFIIISQINFHLHTNRFFILIPHFVPAKLTAPTTTNEDNFLAIQLKFFVAKSSITNLW